MIKRLTAALLMIVLLLPAFARGEKAAVFTGKYDDKFLKKGEKAQIGERFYRSVNVSIEITAQRIHNSDVYIADVYLRKLTSLRRGFSGGMWTGARKKLASMEEIAKQEKAILAITGDNAHMFSGGIVYANGKEKRVKQVQRQQCVLFLDGTMKTYQTSELSPEKLAKEGKGVWQSWMFGPTLLDAKGKVLKDFHSKLNPQNPRSVIGYYAPGHYCLVLIDGRQTASTLEKGKKNAGFTLKQLAGFMQGLGCKAAYNLDGGRSAEMWFNGKVISTPQLGGRSIGDIVYIRK